ncbi:hypothetical protein [Nocardia sp. NPDC050175]|uniref:hypothetical protein n=1 Tax=Nocardia sp. NPDC050175 TaxID=3364317 RepID=UPI0037AE6B48
MALAIGRVAGTVCDLLGVDPPSQSPLRFAVVTGDDQGQPDAAISSGAGQTLPQVSFVYWLHIRPRRFCGGQLRVYDVGFRDGHPSLDAEYRDCPVEHDTVVFFPATFYSELRPATRPPELRPMNAPLEDLPGSRFAVRGSIA